MKTRDIINIIDESKFISLDDSFKYANICTSLINSNIDDGRKLVIRVLDNWDKIPPSTYEMWTDVIEVAGFYPYLEKEKNKLKFNNLTAEIRKGIHLSNNLQSKYFHEDQLKLLNLLQSDKNVIVSAPTSFGKSLLIEETVASRVYRNIVIIQPTLALLDETRHKLLKYRDDYKLIVRTSQEPSEEKGNIFLFTAERVNEYQFFSSVEFLVIDEFYKLSGQRDDERSSSLNNAFYHLLKRFSPKFYLLGPNIDKISPGFAQKYNAVFYWSNYSLVDSNQIDIYKKYRGEFGNIGRKREYKEKVLFDLLLSLDKEQTIIYCSSPQRVRDISKKFSEYLKDKKVHKSKNNYPIIDWIKDYISTDWSLIENLEFEIGIHDGALQKHITTTIIDYFNKGLIKYLFCTSTIIEGVNTSAKNIVYFDSRKGPRDVDYFDYSNIKGRAGRMMEHYVGNIYNFNEPPEKTDIIIDIPFYQQDPIKDEVLIQLDDDIIKNKETKQFTSIKSIPDVEKEIIKKNGVSVFGQKEIFDIIRNEIETKYNLIYWDGIPRYDQLGYILGLAWNNLIVEGETTRPMTLEKLVNMTFNYAIKRNINFLVQDHFAYQRKLTQNKNISSSELMDKSIQDVFQTMKHWFQYKVPKWLSVVNEIQKVICAEKKKKAGSYIYYANLIENDFLPENLAILAEYGIPSSAIRKLETSIPEYISQDDVLNYIKDKSLYNSKRLLQYERNKIIENIN